MSPGAFTTLAVIPTMPDIARQLSDMLTAPLAEAGRRAGQQAGREIAAGLRQAVGPVAAASEQLARARQAEITATTQARRAEEEWRRVREGGIATARRVADAADAVRRARTAETQATDRARQAARDFAAAERDTTQANREAGQSADGLSAKLKGLAGAGAGLAGVAGVGKTFAESMDFEVVNDKLAASLGASPALARDYAETTASVYTQAFGGSMQEVSGAVGAVALAFGTLGTAGESSLEDVTKTALSFAGVFGTEVNESVQTASQLVTNGLAKNSTEAFDLMTASFQRVPVAMRDELPEILNEYGTNFRALGFTGEQSFSLLVDAAGKGKFALDKTGDALKEFTIRGSDMSKTSVEAYKAIGLNAEDMSRMIASGGPAAQEALRATAAGLLKIQDPAERANTSIALFGTPMEDLSVDQIPQFLSALTGAESNMTGFGGAAQRMSDTVGGNATSKLDNFTRSLQVGLVTGLNTSIGFISRNADLLTHLGIVAGVTGIALGGIAIAQGVIAAGSLAAWLRGTTAATWLFNSALLANPLAWIVIGVAAVVAAVILMWNKWDGFRNFITGVWSGITAGFGAFWGFVKPILQGLGSFVTDTLGPALLGFWHGAVEPALTGVKFAFDLMWAGVRIIWELFKLGLTTAGNVVGWWWNTMVSPVLNLAQAGFSVWWSGVRIVWDALTSVVGVVGDKFTWLWRVILEPVMAGIRAAIGGAWDFMRPVFGWIGAGIDGVGIIAGKAAEAAKTAFGGLVGVIKIPLRMVGTLLAGVPESILGVSIPGAGTVREWGRNLQGLRGGGTVAGRTPAGVLWGPGTGTSDSILGVGADGVPTALVSAREGVVSVSAMDNGGAELVSALNGGWVPPLELLRAMLPALAAGGVAGQRAASAAKAHNGDPYVYGGLDCSGIHSLVTSELTGKKVRFTTASDLAAYGFKKGLEKGGYNIGTNGGVGTGGHMVGDLFGTAIESSSDGVMYGGKARDATALPQQWHLPRELWAPPETDDVTKQAGAGALVPSGVGGAPSGAAAPGSSGAASAGTAAATGGSRLKTWNELGKDMGGILADGLAESLGLPSWLTDPNELIKGDDGANVRTTGQVVVNTTSPLVLKGLAEPVTPGLRGMAEPLSVLGQAEPLLRPDRWAVPAANVASTDAPKAGVGQARPGGDTFIAHGYTAVQVAEEWRRGMWARTGGYGGRSW